MSKVILITGGTGYIGSHTAVELISNGYDVFIIDNLSNSKFPVIDRIKRITGKQPGFAQIDIRNKSSLSKLFKDVRPDAVIHFAGLKAVGESVKKPIEYYDNNVSGSLTLFDCMIQANVKTLVFSSSATVYGEPASVPISEGFPLSANNPYGRSKLMIEEILRDMAYADPNWHMAILRYFNPVGAHSSGLIGEDPTGVPNNLMPYVAQVAAGKLKELSIFGNDYPTMDGTGVRDYIHVVDLALGHLAALNALQKQKSILTANLGTGRGYSVLELVRTFTLVTGKTVPHRIAPRRSGDIAQCYADPKYALNILGWKAKHGIEDMCKDTWRWQQWAEKNLQ